MKVFNRIRRKMEILKRLTTLSNMLKVFSLILSIVLYFLSVELFAWNFYPELKTGYFNVASFYTLVITIIGCAVSTLVSKSLLKKKILKETYFFVAFVISSAVTFFIISDLILDIYVDPGLVVGILVTIGTVLSYRIAGKSGRELVCNILKLFLRKGVSSLAILILVSIPIFQALPYVFSIELTSTGIISYRNIAFDNTQIMILRGEDKETSFTKEIPISFDSILIDSRIVNILNSMSRDLNLKTHLNGLEGNLNKIKQFKIYFTLSDGTNVTSLNINGGKITYNERTIEIASNSSVQTRIYLLQNGSWNSQENAKLHIVLNEATYNLSYSISLPN